jgi:hypothetical protein
MDCIENNVSNNLLLCIHCHGNVFTKSLPSNDRRTHIQTHRLMGGIYEVHHPDGLGCHMYDYVPSFMKTGPGVQKLTGGIHRHTERRSHMPTSVFQNKASRLKRIGRSSNHDTNKSSIASSFIQGISSCGRKIKCSVFYVQTCWFLVWKYLILSPLLYMQLSMSLTMTSAMISF